MRLPPFTAIDWATWAAEMAAQAAVLVTALRLPRPRSHVALFAGVLAAEVFERTVEALYLEGVAVPGVPPDGAARALYHVVQALVTAWPAAVAALAWWAFTGPQKTNGPVLPEPSTRSDATRLHSLREQEHAPSSRGRPARICSGVRGWLGAIVAAWLVFNFAMVVAFPLPPGMTQPALHAFEAACIVGGAVAIVTGWTRIHERAAQVAGYLVCVEFVAATVGPWAHDVFATWRTVGNGMYAVAFVILAAAQWYWRRQAIG